jgi:hypothetical protein
MPRMERVAHDRLRELLDLVLDSLDEQLDGRAVAARAHVSRFISIVSWPPGCAKRPGPSAGACSSSGPRGS